MATADVIVFEKAGGGGQMSTRYSDSFECNHGAQFFTVKTEAFQSFLAPFIDPGIVVNPIGAGLIVWWEATASPSAVCRV